MPKLGKKQVIEGTAKEVRWWLTARLKKFRELSHETMSVNPFMAPVLMSLHSQATFSELADLLLAGHFMAGHATGFGKLIDEKLLPNLFGTTKLDKAFRKKRPFNQPVFTEIDHIINPGTADAVFLSLKSSRWTIQLTMAEKMNGAFKQLIDKRTAGEIAFRKIVVGVIYGTQEALTDKFSIIRGICTGAQHDVADVTADVEVVAGKQFWAWINGGQSATQDWIMAGVLDALESSKEALGSAKEALAEYERAFSSSLAHFVSADGKVDWLGILHRVNG